MKLKVYYGGKTHDNWTESDGRPDLVDPIPPQLGRLVKTVTEVMRQRNPICCLTVSVDEERRKLIASTCFEYVEEKVRFSYSQKGDAVKLTQLPPANMEEEVQQAAVSVAPSGHDPVIREKFVDEEKGVAAFILFETLEKGVLGVTSARGHQERYTLYRLKRGQKPEGLFSDNSYLGTPGYPGRHCDINGLEVKGGKIRVKHVTTKTYSDDSRKPEELVFDLT